MGRWRGGSGKSKCGKTGEENICRKQRSGQCRLLLHNLVRLGLSCVVGVGTWVAGGFGKSGLGGDRSQNGGGEECGGEGAGNVNEPVKSVAVKGR